MIVGCATFAWSTATVTSIMCHQPISVVRFQKTMDMLDEFISVGISKAKTSVYYFIESFARDHLKDNWLRSFLQARGLTKEISLRLHEFCMLKYPNQRKYDEEGVLESLPLGIRRAVKLELFSDVIRKWYVLHPPTQHTKKYTNIQYVDWWYFWLLLLPSLPLALNQSMP